MEMGGEVVIKVEVQWCLLHRKMWLIDAMLMETKVVVLPAQSVQVGLRGTVEVGH